MYPCLVNFLVFSWMFIFTPFPSCLGGFFHVDVVVFLVFACIFIFTFALVYLIHTDESLDFGLTKRHIDSNDPISQATQVASSRKKKSDSSCFSIHVSIVYMSCSFNYLSKRLKINYVSPNGWPNKNLKMGCFCFPR